MFLNSGCQQRSAKMFGCINEQKVQEESSDTQEDTMTVEVLEGFLSFISLFNYINL